MFLKLTNLTLWGYGFQSPIKIYEKQYSADSLEVPKAKLPLEYLSPQYKATDIMWSLQLRNQ